MDIKSANYYTNVRADTLRDVCATDVEAILEIGGGSFGTLKALAERFDAKAVGIDIVDLRHDPRVEVITGSLNDSKVFEKLGDQKFDLIVANDVLEHLLDPQMVLRELYGVCNDGGYIHVSVPNIRQLRSFFQIYFRGTFPQEDAGLFDQTHLRWFCMSDISEMVQSAGFFIEHSYMKGRFVPPFWKQGVLAELLGLQSIVVARK